MDFTKAATYPFDDPDWLKKLGLAALVMIIPIAGPILLQGWGYDIVRKVKANDPMPLAGWDDFGGVFMRGLMLFLAGLVYFLPVFIFVCVGYAAGIAIAGGSAAALSGNSNSDSGAGAMASVVSVLVICCYCLAFLYAIAAGIVYWGGYIRYLDKPEFSTFMQFGENIALVRGNAGDFGMALLFIIGGSIVAGFLGIIPVLGWLLIYPVQTYFASHIIGQLAIKLGGAAKPAM